jgi:hypothetical protein
LRFPTNNQVDFPHIYAIGIRGNNAFQVFNAALTPSQGTDNLPHENTGFPRPLINAIAINKINNSGVRKWHIQLAFH